MGVCRERGAALVGRAIGVKTTLNPPDVGAILRGTKTCRGSRDLEFIGIVRQSCNHFWCHQRRFLLGWVHDAVQGAFLIRNAGDGFEVEDFSSIEGDEDVEDDGHGVFIDQHCTPYLARELSVFVARLHTMRLPT